MSNSVVIEYYKGEPRLIESKCTKCETPFKTTLSNIAEENKKQYKKF